MAEADQTAHPIGWSVYDVAALSSATVCKILDWRAESRKRNGSLTEDEIEIFTESARASADTVGPIWSKLQK